MPNPKGPVTREHLIETVEAMLTDLVSRATLNEEILNDYADRIADLAVTHVRQGQPRQPPQTGQQGE